MALLVLLVIVFASSCWAQFDYGYNPHPKRYTQPPIHIKQGLLQGVVTEPIGGHTCEQYLGIPYAAAPRGGLRFMPPGSAPPWTNVLFADTPGPVCPQKLPDMKNMSAERKEMFKRLAQHLSNESEDCLFLNIYTPLQDSQRGTRKFPVIVYIHGESYEWNSGNPYDGCVLSSYGNVVFITINYRLGILGFLKTGVGDRAHSNFGLKDQVAALLWVQENIGAFGGDPRSVTLMGHGTGAACVNFLMMSPMVVRDAGNELFHRAILMSGSALADWALATNSLQLTLQVAQYLNCPSGDDELAACLRRKRLKEIKTVPVEAPLFVTKFGPIVDGLAVPNIPEKLMSTYTDLFSRYEMMFGITEVESDHLLDNVALIHGLLETERNEILRKYLQARFEYQPDKALDSTLREYSNLSLTSAIHYRDTVLEVLSDGRVAAPVVQTGNYHSAINPKSYMYVFGHSTISKDYLREKSLHGEELQYVFGAPLGGARDLFNGYYTEEEKLFSEIIMTLWTNFAHTGNPIAPHRNSFQYLQPSDWYRNWPRDWPEYDSKNQKYMLLAIPSSVEYKFREQLIQYWNEVLPEKLNYSGRVPNLPKPKPNNIGISRPGMIYPPTVSPRGMPPIFGRATTENPGYGGARPIWPPLRPTTSTDYGTFRTHLQENRKSDTMLGTRTVDVMRELNKDRLPEFSTETASVEVETAHTTMNILIIVGGLFLLVNVLFFAGLYYKRKRLRTEELILKRQYEETNLLPTTDPSLEKKPKMETEVVDPTTLPRGCNVMKMIRQSTKSEDTYEAVFKQSEEGSDTNSKFKLSRQISTSTIDPHAKVRDWIAHEIVQRCSPRFLRRTRQQFALEHKISQQNEQEKKKSSKASDSKTIPSSKTSAIPVTPKAKHTSSTSAPKIAAKPTTLQPITAGLKLQKPLKVSVAIDATPGARGSSVLKQQPIELSKSMDFSHLESETKPLRRSVTMDDFSMVNTPQIEPVVVLRRSKTNVNLQVRTSLEDKALEIRYLPNSRVPESDIIKIHHAHSRSDPVQMPSTNNDLLPQEKLRLKTFDANQDINVTSRDEISKKGPLSPEESLLIIKRRNFPKVLPDFPDNQAQINALKRRSLPLHNLFMLSSLHESQSLEPQSSSTLKNYSRVPPAPPPRTSSTLDRKTTKGLPPICQSSPVKFAEEPPKPPEPTITSNTLHVGPLIPCRQPRKPSEPEIGPESSKINIQPIYDNLRSHPSGKDACSASRPAVKNVIKATPKTIITTDPDNPIKKVDQPKVVIKPSIGKKGSNQSKINKVIPRVVAKDLTTECETPLPPNLENKNVTSKPEASSSASSTSTEKITNSPKPKLAKASQIPTFCKTKGQSSSESSSSTCDGSDTGTVVKRQ